MTSPKFVSHDEAKKGGFFSRRHKDRSAMEIARTHHATRDTRRADAQVRQAEYDAKSTEDKLKLMGKKELRKVDDREKQAAKRQAEGVATNVPPSENAKAAKEHRRQKNISQFSLPNQQKKD